MDESLLSTLDSVAKNTGLSRSEIIRRALIRYLEDNGLETNKIKVRHIVLT
ncbi:MAG: ribbon-helix-helix domain-containing protein [Sulfolobales archaeon]|nr:ribbon-helix-helix domain-containing protein [Sulfolobales archaeon]MDW8082994.1 ribbon-helix-helix domain-containing protein [Sulfolobales archaeon]